MKLFGNECWQNTLPLLLALLVGSASLAEGVEAHEIAGLRPLAPIVSGTNAVRSARLEVMKNLASTESPIYPPLQVPQPHIQSIVFGGRITGVSGLRPANGFECNHSAATGSCEVSMTARAQAIGFNFRIHTQCRRTGGILANYPWQSVTLTNSSGNHAGFFFERSLRCTPGPWRENCETPYIRDLHTTESDLMGLRAFRDVNRGLRNLFEAGVQENSRLPPSVPSQETVVSDINTSSDQMTLTTYGDRTRRWTNTRLFLDPESRFPTGFTMGIGHANSYSRDAALPNPSSNISCGNLQVTARNPVNDIDTWAVGGIRLR